MIVRGLAPEFAAAPLCGTSTIKLIEPPVIHARIARLGWEDSTSTYPGGPWSVLFRFTAVDTYTVILWPSNSKGPGCRIYPVVQATPGGIVGVPERPTAADSLWFDLQGRRMRKRPAHAPAWRKPVDRRHSRRHTEAP